MTLKDLPIGKTATVTTVGGEGALRQHFLDMGLIPKADVTMVKFAPMGDPVEVRIHGYELTLRLADAEKIEIDKIRDTITEPMRPQDARPIFHPGLGEGGKYHVQTGEPLPPGETLTFALAGNQNCGKTTLFNQLTGSNQHVGNFPGVTVDRKDGAIRGVENTLVTDLPGIYSMSPYSSEELVTRRFVLDEHPRGIINIVDATNIERNLYLTMQLMELDVPMVLALNMMDEVRQNGGSVRVNEMEEMLGIPVVPISAAKNEGIEELIDHAVHVAKYREAPGRQDFCDVNDHNGAVHRCLHGIMSLIEDHAHDAGIPVRFAASKLAEGDQLVLDRLNLDQNEKETLEHIITQMEKERGLDRAAAIADMRFSFIQKVCGVAVVKPKESREHARSVAIDRVLTGKYTAIPAFIGIMGLVFWLTFNVIGAFLSNLLDMGIGALTDIVDRGMTAANVNPVLHSLVIDGIFTGVGSVLSFLPVIVTLFFFLSMLEDSGYMARVAFVMDKLLRKIGLSGRSVVPMLIGFGCTVPGVMASRTLPSERDRKMTILLTPFMSCSAKLPIYSFFAAAVVIGDRSLNGLLGQNGAVNLDGRKTVQRFHDRLVRQLQSFRDRLAFYKIGRHTACRDGRAAAEGHELYVRDDVVIDLDVHAHDVAALRVADFTDTVCIFDFANVVRVGEVFHYFCTVCHIVSFPFVHSYRIILKLRDRAAVDDRIPQRTHGAQTVDDLREHLDDIIGVALVVHVAEAETQGTVGYLVLKADGKQHMARVERTAGAGAAGRSADTLKVEHQQHGFALNAFEGEVHVARQTVVAVAVQMTAVNL